MEFQDVSGNSNKAADDISRLLHTHEGNQEIPQTGTAKNAKDSMEEDIDHTMPIQIIDMNLN